MPATPLARFAEEVGRDGAVTCVGGRTQWDVGGLPADGAREVRAPAGIVEHIPAEMVVRCGAATAVAELQAALAEHGQTVSLPSPGPGATVGGVLAVGRSGIDRLGHGHIRDTLLEVRYVSAAGVVVKAGGPVVKNVSGYDVAKLLVGSLGTLGFLGEVVLRCRPLPAAARWLAGEADPFDVLARLHRPTSILWDGTTTWVLLEGHPSDVKAESEVVGPAFTEVEGPPVLPTGSRLSLRPSALRHLTGTFVAEVGVGVVHTAEPRQSFVSRNPGLQPGSGDKNEVVRALEQRIKQAFDPTGRLNPGRALS